MISKNVPLLLCRIWLESQQQQLERAVDAQYDIQVVTGTCKASAQPTSVPSWQAGMAALLH
jgi:hypothetical protein